MLARNRDQKKQDKQQDLMPPRSHSTDKCARCRIYRPLCLCGDIVPLILDTRVTLYMQRTRDGLLAWRYPTVKFVCEEPESKTPARPRRRRSRMRFSCFRVRTLWN